jgi:GNAT superfamily N-acetyltransferase
MEVRRACESDIPLVMAFIKELAEYEHLLGAVTATEPDLREWLFGKTGSEKAGAEAFIYEEDGEPAGYASVFFNFSTFRGRPGLYIEDLFVRPAFRGKGLGKAVMAHLAKLALESGCDRLDWACLDWNAPSIAFYLSLEAKPVEGWRSFRLAGESLSRLADGAPK